MSYYLTVIGDDPVEDGGQLARDQCRAGDDVEAERVGVGARVTIAPEQLLVLETIL